MNTDLISRSALIEKRTYLWDSALGNCACILLEDITAIPAVDAVVLPKEDTEFLANLRRELLTQPTDGNRDPRFWGVIEEVLDWGYEKEFGEGWAIWNNDLVCDVGKRNDTKAVIDELVDQYGFDPDDFEGLDEPEEIVEVANKLCGEFQFSVNYYRVYHEVSENHLFLTKKACMEYIDRYGYNHKKPHTYVMTAERCPEYERLLEILKKTKWRAEYETD